MSRRPVYFTGPGAAIVGQRSANAVVASELGIEPSPAIEELPAWWIETIARYLFTDEPADGQHFAR